MKLKTLTYVALIVAGFFASFLFPFLEVIGFGASTIMSALFLPYLGWKNIWKINTVLFCFSILIMIPNLQGYYSQMKSTIQGANKMIENAPSNRIKTFIPTGAPDIALPFSMLVAYGTKFGMIYSANRIIRKRGIYRIFSF
jgi:hypothetical protein